MQQIVQPETTNWLVQVIVPIAAVVIPAAIVVWLSIFRSDKNGKT